MKARQFHATDIGEKVIACIGTAEHVALIIGKDASNRKFFLRFHLASGDAAETWRTAARCTAVNRDCPMGFRRK